MSEQLQKFLETANEVQTASEKSGHHATPDYLERRNDPDEPDVVFPSPALTLTREEEEKMVTHALTRKQEIEGELGMIHLGEAPGDMNRFVNLRDEWIVKRELCDKMYNGDVEWREFAFPEGSIWEESNITLPMARKIVQQQYSRAQNYFFDTNPWFSARPLRQIDPGVAEKHEFFLKYKAEKSRLKACFNSALKRAFINGEAILKGTFQVEDSIYEDIATVAIDPESGEPLLAGDGDYIFEDDKWIPLQDPETGEYLDELMEPQVTSLDESDPNFDPMATPTPVMVLERDPTTIMPEGELMFSEEKIRRQLIHYQGADLDLVYYQDILIPIRAKSIEDADCIVHLYDAAATDLVQKYMSATQGNAVADPRFIEMVNAMAGADGTPKSRDGKRSDDFNEDVHRGDPVIQVGEFYMRYAIGNEQKNIMLVMDLTNEKPIFFDYIERITADGKRPFRCVRVNPVENRWYGASQVGLFWGLQELLDLTINRINHSQSNSGRIDIIQTEAFYEFDNKAQLDLNNRDFLTLKPGFMPKEAIFSHFLTDIKHDILMNLMQTIQQFAISLGGVASSNDADMAGLDTTKLATGIKHMERVGQEMFGPLIDDLMPGIREAAEMFFKITIANLDEDEDFEFFKNGERQFARMVPDEIRHLDYTIEIELTTYKGEQQLAQITLAREALKEFYNLPYPVQLQAVDLYRKTLKIAQIPNAEHIIEPIDLMAPQPPMGRKVDGETIDDALPRENRGQDNLG